MCTTAEFNDNPIFEDDQAENSSGKARVCADCGVELDEDTGCNEIDDDRFVCDDCYSNYCECDECGAVVLDDELDWWGECRLCPDCMAEHVPSFDEGDNDEETEEAYEEMRERMIGRQTENLRAGTNDLSLNAGAETDHIYSLTVMVDEKGIITDVSRLTCEILLSESTTSSDWRPYPIYDEDYEDIVDEMLYDYLVDEDEYDD